MYISVWISYKVPVLSLQTAKSKEQLLTLPPMKLMTSQSLPPSSASSVWVIMSYRIDLAVLGHRKNYLSLHCFLT